MQPSFSVSWSQNSEGAFVRAAESTEPCQITLQLHPGSVGFSLISSARTCELFSLEGASGGAAQPSYAASLRGTRQQSAASAAPQQGELPGAQAWAVEHRWDGQPGWRAPPTVLLRLLSLAERDVLRLHSLVLLPPRLEAGDDREPADEPAAGPAGGGAGAGGSQMDGVRSMLSQLAAADAGSGGGQGPQDPKRALMAAIAKSVLQQQPPRAAPAGSWPLPGPVPPQQQQPPPQQLPSPQAPQQQQQQEGAPLALLQEQQERVLAAVGGLDARVARLEALCSDMAAQLRLLAAAATAAGTVAP